MNSAIVHSCHSVLCLKALTGGESLHLGAAFSAILNERSQVPALLGRNPLLTGGRAADIPDEANMGT